VGPGVGVGEGVGLGCGVGVGCGPVPLSMSHPKTPAHRATNSTVTILKLSLLILKGITAKKALTLYFFKSLYLLLNILILLITYMNLYYGY
jgi:hypothetical protein